MAKKSLLSQTSKPKKVNKYSESVKSTKGVYEFSVKQEVVYLGNIGDYQRSFCIITKKSKRHTSEYYGIKFEDGNEIDVSGSFLKTLEGFEEWLLEQDKDDAEREMSAVEIQILEAGLEPYKNEKSCFNQYALYERRCHECCYESRCIFRNKYQYDKIKF